MLKNKGPGVVIQSVNVAVDYWPRRKQDIDLKFFFLTHAHTDHMMSLDRNWNKDIYCSKITKDLVIELVKVKPDNIIELEMNTKLSFNDQEFFVTLLDANHCPGAVMFLFEGKFGTILVTGDFRYDPLMFVDSPLSNVEVDQCFFDNTYLNPKHANFSSQSNATNAIIRLIANKLDQNYTVFGIKVNKLGKESLLIDLCEAFETQIAVSKARYARLTQTLNLDPSYFTTEFNGCLFYVLNDENELSNALRGQRKYFINPSALKMNTSNLRLTNYIDELSKHKSNYAQIPYSEHSSYNELIEFAKNLKPKELIPINTSYNDCLNTTRLKEYLSKRSKDKTFVFCHKRQFSCSKCNKWWWDKTKSSKCNKCRQSYDPIPVEEEFGICLFKCSKCSHEFLGFASKKISSRCYRCNKHILPIEVKEKQAIKRKSKFIHSCEKCQDKSLARCPIYGQVLFRSKPTTE